MPAEQPKGAVHPDRPFSSRSQARRFLVLGTSGCGKSTVAAALAERAGGNYVEIDRIRWRDDWDATPDDELAVRLRAETEAPAWAIDGNARSPLLEELVERADAVVWLDYPFLLVLRRLTMRSVRRSVSRERLWDTNNRESFGLVFFHKESPILWMVRSFRGRRRSIAAMAEGVGRGKVLRFGQPRELERWLAGLDREVDDGRVGVQDPAGG